MLGDLRLACLQRELGQVVALLGDLLLRLLGERRVLADGGVRVLVDGFDLRKLDDC